MPTPPHDLRSIDHVCKRKERHHPHPTPTPPPTPCVAYCANVRADTRGFLPGGKIMSVLDAEAAM